MALPRRDLLAGRRPARPIMAPIGGYGVKATHHLYANRIRHRSGPIAFTAGQLLRVRFPCKHIGPGRRAAIPGPIRTMPATVSAIDVPTAVDLAVEPCGVTATSNCQTMADDATQTYLSGAEFAMELWTRETVP